MLKVIGGEQEGEFKAVASGTLPNGKPVVVNADGTVSVAAETSYSESVGSTTVFDSDNCQRLTAGFDSTNGKVVIAYIDGGNSNYGTAIVGTVSGSSISFGTPVVFESAVIEWADMTFDSTAGKIVIVYTDSGDTNDGTAIVGTVSGTSISFGTAVDYHTGQSGYNGVAFDTANNKVVVSYKNFVNDDAEAIVGTISGTSISFGSAVVVDSGSTENQTIAYESSTGKIVIAYKEGVVGYAIVGTVSGTSISFGTRVAFHNTTGSPAKISMDANTSGNVVISYQWNGNSDSGTAIVGTISGTSISFGTRSTYDTSVQETNTVYDSAFDKFTIIFRIDTPSNQVFYVVGTVSGTSISLETPVQIYNGSGEMFGATFDSTNNKVVLGYRDSSNVGRGTAQTIQNAGSLTNLTAENYIGMSRGAVSTFDKSYGSVATYSTNNTNYSSIAYDSNSNKIVIVYADDTDTTGKAVVGTVNSANNTISFGTPVTFNSGTTEWTSVVFDSNSNKIVISYRDSANSYYGTSIVGTVSGTSISFGTEVVFKSTFTEDTNMTFDTTANKVVLSYKVGVANTGNALVGTVSGTSISFGSEATFESGDPDTGADIVYDANANKTVIVYRDLGDSSQGKAVVGTVSGTSISFGTPVIYNTSGTSYSKVVYNSVDNNVIVAYRTASSGARARVGTVSGTTISFGDEATVASTSGVFYIGLGYNPQTNRIALAYGDTGNSNQGTIFEGTISGNTLSFDSGTIFNTNRTQWSAMAYDSTADRIVLNFEDFGDSGRGKAMVIETGGVTRGEVADGNTATLDIIGSVSDNQLSLTAGEKYYVQTDGTLSTTAGSPSVLAGTAITSSKLLVKT